MNVGMIKTRPFSVWDGRKQLLYIDGSTCMARQKTPLQSAWSMTPSIMTVECERFNLTCLPFLSSSKCTFTLQAKTVFQAEIDATCELIDFYRHAVYSAAEVYNTQPLLHSPGVWNRMEYRGLEGFIASITPFNFTAIGGNLSATPALMGNVTLWKPANSSILSNWALFQIMREAGIPDGVINFVPSRGPTFGDTITKSPDLAAISFTGSTW